MRQLIAVSLALTTFAMLSTGCGKSASEGPGASVLLLGAAAAGGPGTSAQTTPGGTAASASVTPSETESIPEVLDPNSTTPDYDPDHPIHLIWPTGSGYNGASLTIVFSKQIDCTDLTPPNFFDPLRWHARMYDSVASQFLKIKKINPDGTLKDVSSHGILLCYTGWPELNPASEFYGPHQLLVWLPGDPGEFRLDNPTGLEGDGQYLFLISHEIRALSGGLFTQVDSQIKELPAGSPYYAIKANIQAPCQGLTYAPMNLFRTNLLKDTSGERYIRATGPGFIKSPLAWPWTVDTMYSLLNLFQKIWVPEWKHLTGFTPDTIDPTFTLPSCVKNPGKLDEFVISVGSAADQTEWSTRCGAEGGIWIPDWKKRTPAQTYVPSASCQVAEAPSCNRTTTLVPIGRWYSPAEKPEQKYTYWDTEVMKFEVKDNCQEGWQKIKLIGMNINGPLPEWYKYFALTLQNEQSGAIYGVTLAASDTKFSSATALVYLPKGNTSFQLRWHNDAAKEHVYDANLLIKSVGIVATDNVLSAPSTSLKKTGRAYCDLTGRIYLSGKGAIWYGTGSSASYCFSDIEPGKYRIRLTGGGIGSLPVDYKAFSLTVSNGNALGTASLPSNVSEATGDVILNLDSNTRLSVALQNGFGPNTEASSGFELRSIQLKRLGPSE